MSTPGFAGNGFYTSRLLFGGGTTDLTIANGHPTCILGVAGYSTLPNFTQDIICRNLTLNDTLVPVASNAGYRSSRIYCSGTLEINDSGTISVDGSVVNGGIETWTQLSGAIGYSYNLRASSLGGSGSGGNGNQSGPGSPGGPASVGGTFFYLGGSGGSGHQYGDSLPGSGGDCFELSSLYEYNPFQQSIYSDAIVYGNNDIVTYPNLLFPHKIYGGGGGGGNADAPSSTGGGGAGGGVCYIAAEKIVINSTNDNVPITANGQSSNGGGGGGGVIILVTNELVFNTDISNAISAKGGAGGNAGSTNGNDGIIMLFSDQLVAVFHGTLNKAIYEEALLARHSA